MFGGHVTVVSYGDLGMPAEAPGAKNVVFGEVVAANGFRVMAYDNHDRRGAIAPRPALRLSSRARSTPSHRVAALVTRQN